MSPLLNFGCKMQINSQTCEYRFFMNKSPCKIPYFPVDFLLTFGKVQFVRENDRSLPMFPYLLKSSERMYRATGAVTSTNDAALAGTAISLVSETCYGPNHQISVERSTCLSVNWRVWTSVVLTTIMIEFPGTTFGIKSSIREKNSSAIFTSKSGQIGTYSESLSWRQT